MSLYCSLLSPAARKTVAVAVWKVAAGPLISLHCLLVLDGLHQDVIDDPDFLELLMTLLKSARVRTLLTMVEAVSQPLQGGAEKVIQVLPLTDELTARLLCRQKAPNTPCSPAAANVLTRVGASYIILKALSFLLHRRLAPRPLKLSELPGATGTADFLQVRDAC